MPQLATIHKNVSYKTSLVLCLAAVYVVWGSTFLGVKYAIEVLPPFFASAIRFLVGGSILYLYTRLSGRGNPPLRQWKSAGLIGLLLTGVGNSAVAYALLFMPSGVVALLVAALPAWIVALDYWFFSRKKPHWLTLAGIGVGLVGMAMLFNPFTALKGSPFPIFPALLVFFGSISWGLGTLLASRIDMPAAVQSTAIQMLAGGAVALVFSVLTHEKSLDSLLQLTSTTYWAMAYLIFVGSFVGFSAYTWLIQNAPPQLVATYAYVNPVVALVLGWVFINEILSAQSLVASAVVLSGVVLITLGKGK